MLCVRGTLLKPIGGELGERWPTERSHHAHERAARASCPRSENRIPNAAPAWPGARERQMHRGRAGIADLLLASVDVDG
jgi:hypothetical protein